ncbi:hypothetical protein HHI36_013352 [Cryptolaemus montrouzieri]|uniref:Cadherin domain-containing protein n=1 Tax=Cryptolaemus montrouzieri TaxID=559131 RepID=A0ABD2NH50_9CUCU
MNDHIPIFYPSKFYGAFLKTYNDKSTIVTITATDGDPRDEGNLHFEISNITCTGNLHPQDPAFKIGERDGKVTPTFAITSDMNGYCMFPVNVTDNPDPNGTVHTVSTTVQINIISDDDLVEFVFMNKDQDVVKLQETIQNTIDVEFKNYNYESFMADDVYSAEYGNTTAHFYFLDSITQTPVEASEILGNLTDFEKFTQLKKNLARIDIYLGNFPSSNVVQEVMDYMKIWLMVTTFVLASLLMVLSIGFFFRNRALTQRIKNLSTTKFGSQESGLNRAGVAAPTTNKHAVEGSNPVYNSENYKQEIEAENDSGNSDDDSDLFGVENNPEFDI